MSTDRLVELEMFAADIPSADGADIATWAAQEIRRLRDQNANQGMVIDTLMRVGQAEIAQLRRELSDAHGSRQGPICT